MHIAESIHEGVSSAFSMEEWRHPPVCAYPHGSRKGHTSPDLVPNNAHCTLVYPMSYIHITAADTHTVSAPISYTSEDPPHCTRATNFRS